MLRKTKSPTLPSITYLVICRCCMHDLPIFLTTSVAEAMKVIEDLRPKDIDKVGKEFGAQLSNFNHIALVTLKKGRPTCLEGIKDIDSWGVFVPPEEDD